MSFVEDAHCQETSDEYDSDVVGANDDSDVRWAVAPQLMLTRDGVCDNGDSDGR